MAETDANGSKTDHTTVEAEIVSATDVVLASVAGNEAAIGYLSLGSLRDTVKAIRVDGVEATPEQVKSGAYTLARPFHIATKGAPAGVARDFIAFILSAEGQRIVNDNHYIAGHGKAH